MATCYCVVMRASCLLCSKEEQAWLDALEAGELDDFGRLKHQKDVSMMTARQVRGHKQLYLLFMSKQQRIHTDPKIKSLSRLSTPSRNIPLGHTKRTNCNIIIIIIIILCTQGAYSRKYSAVFIRKQTRTLCPSPYIAIQVFLVEHVSHLQ